MINPFQLFPSIAYKNSQFQLVSSVDDLEIEFYQGDECIRTEIIHSSYPTIITGLNSTGIIVAKCNLDGKEYCQEIEIRDAVRLGSSVFKKAFLFDGVDYSFLLMKDRLLLYDEKKHILYTENHISPTEIIHLRNSLFLFVTRIGSLENGIVNLGIYNTNSFSIQGELLNDFKEIKILAESNKAWLLNSKSNTIHCFQLINESIDCFEELVMFEGFSDFLIDENSASLFLIFSEKILVIDLKNLHIIADIPKNDTNAIDKLGNIFTLVEKSLTWGNVFENFSRNFKLEFNLNLNSADFLHLGEALISKKSPIDFNLIVDKMMVNNKIPLPFNKSYQTYQLPEYEVIKDELITHQIFQNTVGLIISEHKKIRTLKEIKLDKKESEWHARPSVTHVSEYSIFSFESSIINYKLIDKSPSLRINNYYRSMLLVTSENDQKLFFGGTEINFPNDCEVQFFSIADNVYFLVKKDSFYSLFSTKNIDCPLLESVKILNQNYFKEHKIIWYTGNGKLNYQRNKLYAFDLSSCSMISIDQYKFESNSFNQINNIKFEKGYALTYNQILYNPQNLEIKSAFVGNIKAHSKKLNKMLTLRDNELFLSIFNFNTRMYDLFEIAIEENVFNEIQFSPDGQFLTFKKGTNDYYYYNIDTQEKIQFNAGSFIGFNKQGNLITSNSDSKESKRAVRIIDPKTFMDVTPPNYRYYRFLSPDGKLYSETSINTRYIKLFDNSIITTDDYVKLQKDLEYPSVSFSNERRQELMEIIKKNREIYFENNKMELEKLGITSISQISLNKIIKKEKYVKIGIVGTEITAEVLILDDVQFFNYAAFSYDNNFFAYVGKPYENSNYRGFINIKEINFNQQTNTIECAEKSYLSKYPPYATWVCGFSKTGYFATYDSAPVTYCLKIDKEILNFQLKDIELNQNSLPYNHWVFQPNELISEIKGKNFLCFSPSGKYIALSEQGYDPLTLGGYGHQESNVVHIAKTETGEILNSFAGHGGIIKENRSKDTAFVAFSQDEKRIMTSSKDGVVIIRDLKLAD